MPCLGTPQPSWHCGDSTHHRHHWSSLSSSSSSPSSLLCSTAGGTLSKQDWFPMNITNWRFTINIVILIPFLTKVIPFAVYEVITNHPLLREVEYESFEEVGKLSNQKWRKDVEMNPTVQGSRCFAMMNNALGKKNEWWWNWLLAMKITYKDNADNTKHAGVAVLHRDEWRPGRVGKQQPKKAQLCQLPCNFYSNFHFHFLRRLNFVNCHVSFTFTFWGTSILSTTT